MSCKKSLDIGENLSVKLLKLRELLKIIVLVNTSRLEPRFLDTKFKTLPTDGVIHQIRLLSPSKYSIMEKYSRTI